MLTIVILNRNTSFHLAGCLESHKRCRADFGDEVILVDNASSDDSIDVSRSILPGIRVIANDKDVGFARGNNQGLLAARGQYVLFLNPDTQFMESDIGSLLEPFERCDNLGLLGCRLRNPDMTPQPSCHAFPTLPRLFLRRTLGRTMTGRKAAESLKLTRPYLSDGWSPNVECTVDWLLGAFMLGRREFLTALGGFDETFHFFAADLELCWRVRAAGYDVMYSPMYEIVHKGNPNWNPERLDAVRVANCHFVKKYRSKTSGLLLDLSYRLLKLVERRWT